MKHVFSMALAFALSAGAALAGTTPAAAEPVPTTPGHLVVVKAGLLPLELQVLAGDLASQAQLTTYLELKAPIAGAENQFFTALRQAFAPMASLQVLILTENGLPKLFVLTDRDPPGRPREISLVDRLERKAQHLRGQSTVLRGRFQPLL